MANAVTTNKAREKMVKARAGDKVLSKITHMVFGDGGIGKDGKAVPPNSLDNSLKHELLRKPIDRHNYPVSTTCRYSCKLLKNEIADKNINEMGLVDTDGDIVAIKTFGNKYKDADMEMIFEIDDEF
ncbi:phage-related tail fiber protein [Clostridium tetanomorphum]|uniref:Phage tail fibre protein N-terminal domain-containing protein n=1 Tax=Clostridium tetanomorphum TaxID=1553 RepID=A0A923EA30_CLOTT|nr:phage tail protein [Clostridium tetanomorphum]KAJ51096.1 hypothetical protein CTM_14458 [Clostridium tetanomorphum DSM 665]MBC2398017.1 hypothetical protein [Clostridium tetanomorphum]MBP1864476.1 phage-related tail fiber protein [Clostridium tetanomorphum]NRS82993.1 phage-related tail fiber protein [Clostridium tetanomorphum]NRZ98911.1 phage-related tail fiber protein [Clostridium tetanomorphum]